MPYETSRRYAGFLLSLALCIPAADGQETEASTEPAAVAREYPNDQGIGRDPDVIFSDDFETWADDGTTPPANTWQVRKDSVSRTQVIAGRVQNDAYKGPGAGVLEIACWTEGGGSQTGGLSLKLGNYNHAREGLGDGYDEVYVRYYIRFDEDYRAVRNHGANLGGRDVTMPNAAWVGMAGIRDVSTRGYFYSGVQPRGELGSQELEMGFYSYHLDKRGPWGENYDVLVRTTSTCTSHANGHAHVRRLCRRVPGSTQHSHGHPVFSLDDGWALYNSMIGQRHNVYMADVNSLT